MFRVTSKFKFKFSRPLMPLNDCPLPCACAHLHHPVNTADELFSKLIPRMNAFRYKKFYSDLERKLEEDRIRNGGSPSAGGDRGDSPGKPVPQPHVPQLSLPAPGQKQRQHQQQHASAPPATLSASVSVSALLSQCSDFAVLTVNAGIMI